MKFLLLVLVVLLGFGAQADLIEDQSYRLGNIRVQGNVIAGLTKGASRISQRNQIQAPNLSQLSYEEIERIASGANRSLHFKGATPAKIAAFAWAGRDLHDEPVFCAYFSNSQTGCEQSLLAFLQGTPIGQVPNAQMLFVKGRRAGQVTREIYIFNMGGLHAKGQRFLYRIVVDGDFAKRPKSLFEQQKEAVRLRNSPVIHSSRQETRVGFDRLRMMVEAESSDSNGPVFCAVEEWGEPSLEVCLEQLEEQLDRAGFSGAFNLYYVSGDNNTSDFHTVYAFDDSDRDLLLRIPLHEERSGSDFSYQAEVIEGYLERDTH